MKQNIWIQQIGSGEPLAFSTVQAALHDQGIAAARLEEGAPDGDVIVVFNHVGGELDEALRATSRGGRRVLAVAASAAVLATASPWALLRCGAADVLAWDSMPHPEAAIARRLERWAGVDRMLESDEVRELVVGASPAWTRAMRRVVEIAAFTAAPVLVTGESGTGKELIAKVIHALDHRAEHRDLVVLDCTTVSPELAGSEFFGHERGAFTNAVVAREGAFALADGGTLFLDEVGELPPALQAELLRVVQERTYKRVGGNTWHRTEFRLVAATNRDLRSETERGAFRADFYHRITNWTVHLPPLRERVQDIIPLAEHFMCAARDGEPAPAMDEAVRAYLLKRDYPGNVRELRGLVGRIMTRHVGEGPITIGALPEEDRPADDFTAWDWRNPAFLASVQHAVISGVGLKEIGRATTEAAYAVALETAETPARAARLLGVSDRAVQMHVAAKRGDPERGDPERGDPERGDPE